MRKLSELKSGERGIVCRVSGYGSFRKRVMEMGFVRGHEVEVLHDAPLRDPVKYKILGYEVSLRRSEAALVEVEDDVEEQPLQENQISSAIQEDDAPFATTATRETASGKRITVALIGNPNSGKTSLFNLSSGGHERVGNYSGVTVDAKEGHISHKGYHIRVIDLPGTYSLDAYSPEELYVRRYIKEEQPDVLINVVDGSNLHRNLYLTTELIDMDRSVVIALNMYDELRNSGAQFDHKALASMIGVPIIPTVSRSGEGIEELFDTIVAVYEGNNSTVRHVHVNLGQEIEEAIKQLRKAMTSAGVVIPEFSPRYIAIKLLEGDAEVEGMMRNQPGYTAISMLRNKWVAHIEEITREDIVSVITNQKYGFIAGALRETFREGTDQRRNRRNHTIDTIVTHRLLGFPLFIALMFIMFYVTFQLGAYPQEWIEMAVDWISSTISDNMTPGPLKDLLVDGIIAGVGGVIVFLPQIMILYLFISFMEDSGYMARAAFIMDKLMHRMGLHGKSFIPMVMGFGCNVPAIMASRIIESKSSRLITMLATPFMSCSARLPIYVLIVSAFFPEHAAVVFLGLYLLGMAVAVITALLLRKFHFGHDETPFVMELPPYRLPTLKSAAHHMWEKAEQYLRKMGTIILVGSIAVWALNYFPRDLSLSNEMMTSEELAQQQEQSYLAKIGKAIAPVMAPMDLGWRATVAIISGATAKEIVVSTLGVLYCNTTDVDDEDTAQLEAQLRAPDRLTGEPDFNNASALAFMVFVLLYFPCIATIVAIAREAGSWRYGLFTVIYNTAVAWVVALIVYQIAVLI